ncbi:hypothetical protein CSKR_107156 [Clonorchis sinensis]|uniref:Uncharacterized protein n=1 Tax=Clonorchis sinensis TaxID=79923 RepID=A0A3R7GS83_CLOSI|nr:hypothetical protein CSKR_107156 [Clonorchis sinensis]
MSYPSLDRSSQDAGVGFEQQIFRRGVDTRRWKVILRSYYPKLEKILPDESVGSELENILTMSPRLFAGSTVKNLLAMPCSNRALVRIWSLQRQRYPRRKRSAPRDGFRSPRT